MVDKDERENAFQIGHQAIAYASDVSNVYPPQPTMPILKLIAHLLNEILFEIRGHRG